MTHDYALTYDGDLWRVERDGDFVDCFSSIQEAAEAIVTLAHRPGDDGEPVLRSPTSKTNLRQLFIDADSELSAIAHGRSPSDKAELLRLSDAFRKLYQQKSSTFLT